MKTEKLFEITRNSDNVEGKGYSITLGYVRSIDQAKAIVNDIQFKRYCVMGVHTPGKHDHEIRERDIIVYDTPEEFWREHDNENKRQKALAKLTDEDKRLLGLDMVG